MANSEHTSRSLNHGVEWSWITEEYEAGYEARFQGVAECGTATPCWRTGWQDADREMAGAALAEGTNLDATAPWTLFGTGQQARACELPFDELSPDSWKKSWVEADITLSLAMRKGSA